MNSLEREYRAKLKEELKQIIYELETNGYPNLLTLDTANLLVSKIKEILDTGDEAKVGCEDSGRIKLCWVQKKDMGGNISSAAVISAFKKFPESIEFLIKIKCQQLVRDNENPKFKTIVERLIRQGFIDEIQVDIINKRHYFYVLSDKGNLIFNDHNIWNKINSHFPDLSAPRWLIQNADDSILTQGAIINLYADYKNNMRYVTFTFKECADLLFSCGIDGNQENTYLCAMGSDNSIDLRKIRIIEKIINDNHVRKIVIICINNNYEAQVKDVIDENLVERKKIEIHTLEENNGEY